MKQILKELYLEQGLNRKQISDHLGYSFEQVCYLLKKFNVRKNGTHSYKDKGSKKCPSCNQEKPISEFHKRKNKRPGSWCKSCMTKQAVARQRKYKEMAIEYKGGACISCGFAKYAGSLDFHHVDPKQKDAGVSKLTRSPMTDKIQHELDKCVLLCANCHRMVHGNIIILNEEGVVLSTPWN